MNAGHRSMPSWITLTICAAAAMDAATYEPSLHFRSGFDLRSARMIASGTPSAPTTFSLAFAPASGI